jgi:CBS domain-containing protein
MKAISAILTGRAPLTRPGATTALDAARAMHDTAVGALLVVDEQGRMQGIFTERDLMVRIVIAGKNPREVHIQDAMSRDVLCATPEQHINDVAREMQERHVRHLPVLQDGKPIAILSLRDLLSEYLEEKSHEVDALTAYIHGEEEGRPPPSSF